MALKIQRGPQEDPIRLFLYGQEGIGKTTLAAGLPRALFLSAEDGAGDLVLDRVQIDSWKDLRTAVRELAADAQGYETVVLDSASALERLLHAHICADTGASSIEDVQGGFGKGYTAASEAWSELCWDLDLLRQRQRVAVVVIGHAEVKVFNDPTGPSFDRYQPRMHGKSAAALLQWADLVAFAGWDTTVKTGKRRVEATDKGKAVAAVRRLFTSKDAAFDAKSRYALPAELDVSAKALMSALDWPARAARWRGETAKAKSPGDAFAELGVDLARLDAWLVETQGKPLAELDRTAAGSAYRALRNDPELRARLGSTPAAADAAPGAR
jgi:hypothetical protein